MPNDYDRDGDHRNRPGGEHRPDQRPQQPSTPSPRPAQQPPRPVQQVPQQRQPPQQQTPQRAPSGAFTTPIAQPAGRSPQQLADDAARRAELDRERAAELAREHPFNQPGRGPMDHDDHDHHDDHHDDHDRERREQQEQMQRAILNAAAVAAAMQKPPDPPWHPRLDNPPPYRDSFAHDDGQVAVQFAVTALEQRAASLEALVNVQGAMLKTVQAQLDAIWHRLTTAA